MYVVPVKMTYTRIIHVINIMAEMGVYAFL